ncbi:insulinase family protein [Clostridium tetani]|nr:insulinase family protein [Clostridium tetani]
MEEFMYKLYSLNNGLRVALEKIDYVQSVSIGLWVKNGSRNENEHNNGISHFIEHMMFKGTNNRNAKEIVKTIEDLGGHINAFTGKEATCYYIKLLYTHLDVALDILSDMIFNSKFNEEDIELEKGVILEEISMNEDSPEDVLVELHSKAAWGDDPISLPILGSAKGVRSFTRNHIIEYLKSHYTPENCVISIAGNFDENIYKLIEDYFGHWKASNEKPLLYSTPDVLNNHLFRKKEIEQLHMNLGMQGVEIGNEDMYTILLLNNIFGGSTSSILFQKIREEKGRCYSIYSYVNSYNNTGIVNIYTGLNSKYSIEVLKLIVEEVHKFSKYCICQEQIIQGKEGLKGSYILGLESTSSRMFSNARSVLFLNRINKPEDIIKKIDKIDMESIHRVKENTFEKGIINSAFVGENIDIETVNNMMDKSINLFKNNSNSTFI